MDQAYRLTLLELFQSTPFARRATLLSVFQPVAGIISIHALREEGDLAILRIAAQHPISIHALREEGDASPSWCWPSRANFNPRPPRGGRHSTQRLKLASSLFQSTPSARRTTEKAAQAKQDTEISIHALREEGD